MHSSALGAVYPWWYHGPINSAENYGLHESCPWPPTLQFYGIVLPSAPPPALPITPGTLAPLRSLSFDAVAQSPRHDDHGAAIAVPRQQSSLDEGDIRRTASLPVGQLVRGGIMPPAPALVSCC